MVLTPRLTDGGRSWAVGVRGAMQRGQLFHGSLGEGVLQESQWDMSEEIKRALTDRPLSVISKTSKTEKS